MKLKSLFFILIAITLFTLWMQAPKTGAAQATIPPGETIPAGASYTPPHTIYFKADATIADAAADLAPFVAQAEFDQLIYGGYIAADQIPWGGSLILQSVIDDAQGVSNYEQQHINDILIESYTRRDMLDRLVPVAPCWEEEPSGSDCPLLLARRIHVLADSTTLSQLAELPSVDRIQAPHPLERVYFFVGSLWMTIRR